MLLSTLLHVESGQWIKSYLPLLNPKEDCQGFGAAITYMRRYSINSMLGLTAEDDDGESACLRDKNKPPVSNDKNIPPTTIAKQNVVSIKAIDDMQYRMLEKLRQKLPEADRSGLNGWIKSTFGADNLRDIPETAFEKVLDALTKKLALQGEQ